MKSEALGGLAGLGALGQVKLSPYNPKISSPPSPLMIL